MGRRKFFPYILLNVFYQTSYNLNILHTMKTNQIFVKKLSDKALVINNHTYNLSTMNEEELLKLSQLLDDLRKQQVGKISTAELIFANTTAKKPVMQEASSEREFKFKKRLFEKEIIQYGEAVGVAHTNLQNARKKKEIIQDLIMIVGFTFLEVESQEEPSIWMVNLITDERKYVGIKEATTLQDSKNEEENWVYTSEIDVTYQEN